MDLSAKSINNGWLRVKEPVQQALLQSSFLFLHNSLHHLPSSSSLYIEMDAFFTLAPTTAQTSEESTEFTPVNEGGQTSGGSCIVV